MKTFRYRHINSNTLNGSYAIYNPLDITTIDGVQMNFIGYYLYENLKRKYLAHWVTD